MILHNPIVSGSLTFAENATLTSANSTITGSFKGTITATNGLVSSSAQANEFLPSGVLSGSAQISSFNKFLELNGDSVVSSSAQIDGTTIQNNTITIVGNAIALNGSISLADITNGSGIVSGSSQLTSTLDTRYLNTNSDSVISGSSQVNHDSTTGFVANEHIDHTGVTLTAGNGLTGGGNIASSRTFAVGAGDGITVNANDVAVDSTVLRKNGDNVVSSSAFSSTDQGILRATINGSNTDVDLGLRDDANIQFNDLTLTGDLTVAGTTTTTTSNAVNIGDNILNLNYGGSATVGGIYVKDATGTSTTSGSLLWDSTNGKDYWKAGKLGSESELVTVSNLTSKLPDGVVSGSAQITLSSTTGYNANEHFTQAQITTLGTVTSGNVTAILPDGVVSGSTQLEGTFLEIKGDGVVSSSAQLTSDLDSRYLNTNSDGVVSGSAQINLSGVVGDTDDVDEGSSNLYYTDARVKAKLTAENVVSSSAQLGLNNNTITFTAGAGLDGGGSITLNQGSDETITFNVADGVVSGSVLRPNGEGVISGSSQVDIHNTTGYVANENIDHTSVSITAGDGLTGGGDISSTRTLNIATGNNGITINADNIALNTSSTTFTSGVKSKLNAEGVFSSSAQIEGNFLEVNGDGVISGSAQLTSDFDTRYLNTNSDNVISGSSQVSLTSVSGYVANEHINHSNVNITAGTGLTGGGDITTSRTLNVVGGDGITANANDIAVDNTVLRTTGDGVVSGSVLRPNGDGVISGSAQLTSTFDSRYLNTNSDGVISGSSQVNADSITNFDTNVKAKLNAEDVVSGSSQIDIHSTTGYVANEHIDHSTITIGSGKGLTGGGTIVTSRSLSLATGSAHFTAGVVKGLPGGTISGSSQVDYGSVSNTPTIAFTAAGDGGSNQTISNGNTLTLAGGTDLESAGSATDTITINHSSVSRSNTTSAASPAAGNTFDVVDSITTSATGHITAVNTATITLPIDTDDDVSVANLETRLGQIDSDINIGDVTGRTFTFRDNVVITGNLTVSGNTTTTTSETLNIEDNLITLNSNVTGTPSENGGIEVERGSSTNSSIIWDESNDIWKAGISGSEYQILTTNNNTDNLSEGSSNLYYTSARFNSDFSGKDTDDLNEGSTALYYTDGRVKTKLNTDSVLSGSIESNLPSGVVSGSSQVNYNSISNKPSIFKTISVGGTSLVADSDTDTLNITAGSNITLTPNTGTDTFQIAATNTTYTAGVGLGLSGTQFNFNGKGTGVISGSVLRPNGDGVISGSAQLTNDFLEVNGDSVVSSSAQVNTLYNSAVSKVTSGEITAGTETGVRRYSPADIKDFIDGHPSTNTTYDLSVQAGGANTSVIRLAGSDSTNDDVTISGGTGITIAEAGNTITITGTAQYGDSDVLEYINGLAVVSGSSQISHDSTTGFVANEHINHSSVTLTAGNGLTGGGTIAASRTFAVGQGDGISVSANAVAVDGTVLRTTGDGVVSGSAQISGTSITNNTINIAGNSTALGGSVTLAAITNGTGIVSGSSQVSLNGFDTDDLSEGSSNQYFTNARARGAISATGDISYDSSTGVISFTNDAGDIEGVTAGVGLSGGGESGTVTLNFDGKGTGVVSGSSQITLSSVSGYNANEHFTQGNITTLGTVTSGNITQILPDGLVSESVQVSHDSTTGFVANEHINHTSVSITAGTGLTGGGTIAANRTINVVGGDGITANANDIEVDNTVLRTTSFGVFSGSAQVDYNSIQNTPTIPTVNNNTITFTAGAGLGGGGSITLNQGSDETVSFKVIDGVVSGSSQINAQSATNPAAIYDNSGTPTLRSGITAAEVRTAIGVDAAGTNNYSHPSHDGDDIDIDTTALTGATVISDLDINITTNTLGHVTDANGSVSTRNLTLSDLGFTGDSNANNYSHPTFDGDDIDIDTGALTGATVISDLDLNITTNSEGHVTDANGAVSTRTLTAANLGLGNVTNESKATMFTDPTFTGTVSGVTATHVGLGNVTNESKATMFSSPAFTGNATATTQAASNNSTRIATTAFVQGRIDDIIGNAGSTLDTLGELSASLADDQDSLSSLTTTVGTKLAKSSNLSDLANTATALTNLGLNNVTNESKATMFTSPTFTGTVSGVTKTHVGLGNVENTALSTYTGQGGALDNQYITNGANYISSFDITTQTDSKYLRSNANDTATGVISITNTTASTSKTTGALKVTGGVGIQGALNVGGDVVAFASSDERLKDNIELISNPIEKVQSLKGVTWDWNENADELQQSLPNVGVIAQDVEKVLPELVTDRDNGYKGVDYAKLTGLLIEAIKEQQKEIDELKSKIK